MAHREPERIKEEKLREKLERGEKIESLSQMSEQYREQLTHLMMMQADSELAGAFGYVPWIMKSPDIKETLQVAQIVKDEVRHARVMYRLLEGVGVDVDRYYKSHNFSLRVDAADLGTLRAAADQRVNIFYYPIETWYDFIMFNFCMDRGAGHQLEDALDCSYKPWCDGMEGIFKEEAMHMAHGDQWTETLAKDEASHDELQRALDKWYPRTMNIFGRKDSPRNKVYRALGLKKRDNDQVRQAFAKEIGGLCRRFGLRVPDWKPEASKMSEEPFIPG
ncbi:MAG: phenylacetate-CoA oxygenase subunit PaaI [Elusimicrobia bacterium]|nr:phenylacetate-CoA oxygenase subunit PaaI [Elusimicrobiota bacterium]MDE2426448.1 phenylacetate-CoA oxygenase subunit PaaI [Elusimicrobiota bacterium]